MYTKLKIGMVSVLHKINILCANNLGKNVAITKGMN